jgi:hypothetical protein
LSRAFQRHQEDHNLKHPSSMDLMITIQNKTTSLLSIYALVLIASFPKTRRTWSKAFGFGGSHIYKTKQNKTNYLPSIYAPHRSWELSKNTKNMIWSIRVWWISYLPNKTKQTTFILSMHPVLDESFPKTRRTWSEAFGFGGSHIYKTKQNKTNYLPS